MQEKSDGTSNSMSGTSSAIHVVVKTPLSLNNNDNNNSINSINNEILIETKEGRDRGVGGGGEIVNGSNDDKTIIERNNENFNRQNNDEDIKNKENRRTIR